MVFGKLFFSQAACRAALAAGVLAVAVGVREVPAQARKASPGLRIVNRTVSQTQPDFYTAVYTTAKGRTIRSGNRLSADNGVTWVNAPMTPDYMAGLAEGFRRAPTTWVLDPKKGLLVTIVNSLDVPGLDPKIAEPPIAQKTYYLRYRVSADGGKTWLFEEPIVAQGNYTSDKPFDGIEIGKSSIYVGDQGCIPLVIKNGSILVPVQTTPMTPEGTAYNPGNGHTYTDVLVLIGSWDKQNRLVWRSSARVTGDPEKSTRGMIEPTLTELNDGRVLMVMRGSNISTGQSVSSLPSYKWYSISKDGGLTWDKPQAWTYDDGTAFFSPSAMSTLFRHSSGRHFWIGNITGENPQGNLPRWPLVMGEVDGKSAKLIRSSVLTLDTREMADESRGRLDISHFTVTEDRQTKEIVVCYPRSYNAYKSREWVSVRLAVE